MDDDFFCVNSAGLSIGRENVSCKEFPYVLDVPAKPRIAFGTAIRFGDTSQEDKTYRSTVVLKPVKSSRSRALSRLLSVSSLMKKYPSKYGHAAFVSKVPRLSDAVKRESVDVAYNLEIRKPIKHNYTPFNSGVAKATKSKFVTPGPSTYPYHEKLSGYNYCIGFGKKRRIWPATAVFCSAQNTAKCSYCQKQPEGDYLYNFKTKLSLCRRCFKWQYMNVTKCGSDPYVRNHKLCELNEFKPVRYCDFYHKHVTEELALALIPESHLRQKIRFENYLYLYQPLWYKSKPWRMLERKL